MQLFSKQQRWHIKDPAGGHLFILRWFIAEQHVHQREISRSSYSGALNLTRSCAHRLFKRCYGLKHFEEKNNRFFYAQYWLDYNIRKRGEKVHAKHGGYLDVKRCV